MLISGNDGASNRFFPHRSTLIQPGVNSEFVHSKILDPVQRLIANLEQTIKNSASDSKQKGITVLRECLSRIDQQLNDTHHKLNP